MAIEREKALYRASLQDCGCLRFIEKTQRTKTLPSDIMQTSLKRCLNSFDLTLFGIGHMIGGGIYVLTGTVAKKIAGPGVVFSYIIAGIVSILVALCYAEFGSKIPKTGSAYMYTYVILGECWAYLVAWDLILEQAIGAAAVARAWSGAVNVLTGGAVENGTIAVFGTINSPLASSYPDLLSVALLVVLTIIVVAGVRFNSIVNNVLTVTNLFFLAFTIIAAFIFAEPQNWENSNNGGPLPFGFGGVLAGSATVFFSYVGFECVTQAAEEATRPARSVPIGTMGAMSIVTLLYVLAALSLTMLAPYATIDVTVPFAKAFANRGITWMQYITAVGTLVATTTTTMASLYSLSRLVYALAQDRLFFTFFAYVNSKTHTPIIATIVFSIIAMIMAAVTDIDELAEMLSAGTLMAFSFLAIDVLVLRYLPIGDCPLPLNKHKVQHNIDNVGKLKPRFAQMRMFRYMELHSKLPLPKVAVFTMCVSGLAFFAMILRATDYLVALAWWAILLTVIFGLGIALPFIFLLLHDHNTSLTSFQVPMVPWIPAASFLLNAALLVRITGLAWIRVVVWDSFGFVIYFLYGIHHSLEGYTQLQARASIAQSIVSASDLDDDKASAKELGKVDKKRPSINSDDAELEQPRDSCNMDSSKAERMKKKEISIDSDTPVYSTPVRYNPNANSASRHL